MFTSGVIAMLSPTPAEGLVPWILLPSFVGEVTLVCLVSRGVVHVAAARLVAA